MANHSTVSAAGVLTYSGATNPNWISNIAIKSATTTNANDSIKITSSDGTALSTTNPGWLTLPSVTPGQSTTFEITADVTILLTGAHWGLDTKGDITGGLLRVLAINDNTNIRFGVAYLGGRHTILTTDTSATQGSVTLAEHVLCNSAVTSSSNTCAELGFIRSNFDDTGGAAENLWANQTGVGDIVTGKTADGLRQPWNPTYTGFTATVPTAQHFWSQTGRVINANVYVTGADGVSNATSFQMSAPAASVTAQRFPLGLYISAGATKSGGSINLASGTITWSLFTVDNGAWLNDGLGKSAYFGINYNVGPAASFIE